MTSSLAQRQHQHQHDVIMNHTQHQRQRQHPSHATTRATPKQNTMSPRSDRGPNDHDVIIDSSHTFAAPLPAGAPLPGVLVPRKP
jgi:hypothetical protein